MNLSLLDEGCYNLLTLSLLDEGCYNRLTLSLLDEGCYNLFTLSFLDGVDRYEISISQMTMDLLVYT